jgi:hypothetical protein
LDPVGDLGSLEKTGEGSGKDFTWSKGLGFEISPIKTQSARKKAVSLASTSDLHLSNFTDNGALRGMKSLARAKS